MPLSLSHFRFRSVKTTSKREHTPKIPKTSKAQMAHVQQQQQQEKTTSKGPQDLAQLVDAIEAELFHNDEQKHLPLHKKTNLQVLLEQFPVNMDELQQFAHFDTSRNYTRNLISTDHESYALMLICWNRGKYSPIHDHPSDGCWVKVIQGFVHEVRYQKVGIKLVETASTVLTTGVTYMDDSLGLHKVGNPHAEVDAITMHLYSPPYEKCRVWFDPNDADKSSVAVSNYYTEFGEKIEF